MKRVFALFLSALLGSTIISAQTTLKGSILSIDFSEGIAERGGNDLTVGLNGISTSSNLALLSVERAIEKAAGDDKIAMIFLKTDKYNSGLASSEELRKCLESFRASGKKVVSYATTFNDRSYYLASGSDLVVMNPSGDGTLSGMSSTLLFYKDILDTLGVKVQLIRHGKYKSAGEPYIRNDISPENREQYEQMLGSIWQSRMAQIASSRGLDVSTLDSYVENLGIDKAQSWYEKGLVDTLWTKKQMEDYLCESFGVDKKEYLSVIPISKYVSKLKKGPSKAKIAVIFADGTIGSGSDIDGIKMAETISKVRADSTVKAIVWRVNSPGGEVTASDLIRTEIDETRKVKPVIASYGTYAASGGYWISSSSDRIFTDNSTLTGSIGVFGMIPALGDAIRKNLKINPVSVGTHSHSDMVSGMREMDDGEREWMQSHIDEVYERFVSLVAQSRDLDKEFVDSIAQGRVWSGVDAIRLGLADEIGTATDALRYAASVAGVQEYRIVYYPEPKSASLSSLLKQDDQPLVRIEPDRSLLPAAKAMSDVVKMVSNLDSPSVQARMSHIVITE